MRRFATTEKAWRRVAFAAACLSFPLSFLGAQIGQCHGMESHRRRRRRRRRRRLFGSLLLCPVVSSSYSFSSFLMFIIQIRFITDVIVAIASARCRSFGADFPLPSSRRAAHLLLQQHITHITHLNACNEYRGNGKWQ